MREESKSWIEYSRRDLLAARNSLKSGDYYVASFLAQQTAEKAMKAVMVSMKGDFPKIHDLVILGRGVDLPRDLLDHAKELTRPILIQDILTRQRQAMRRRFQKTS